MLAADEKKLRWWGMDMRPRWRRRLAVWAGYSGFLVPIALMQDDRFAGHPILAALGTVVLTLAWRWISIFRENGVVKSFEDPPSDKVYAAAGKAIVDGLDEWARYRYGVASFEAASEEQQAELLKLYRVGRFLVPAKERPWGLDERERDELNGAARWSLRWSASYMAVMAGSYVGRAVRHQLIGAMEVAGDLWSFFLLSHTLPQARVLWTEPDPRESGGEMELVAE